MNAEESSQAEEIESEQSKDLTELRKQIELTNAKLLELVYNEEKFIEHFNNLNLKGIQCLNNEQHKEAMIYFNENQRILEYVASCGKTMDRSVIVATLHNQACVNQKLWDLQKSANYLQAIIYNMSYYFQNVNKASDFQKLVQKNQQVLDDLATYIQKKQMFALYHLQFCAVNSQIRKHTISGQSARTAITIMNEVCNLSYLLSQNIIYSDVVQVNQARQNSQLLKQLSSSGEDLQIKDYKKNFKAVKMLINANVNQEASQDQFKNIRNFSIGKLMHLTPLSITDMQSKWSARLWVKQQNIFNMALYMGVCYFTVGTELRFISSQKNQENNEEYKLSQEFLMSQVYHIYSIMVVMKFVPVRSIFLNHLLSSFNNHYEIDLERAATNVNLDESNIDEQVLESRHEHESMIRQNSTNSMPSNKGPKQQNNTQNSQIELHQNVSEQRKKKQIIAEMQNSQYERYTSLKEPKVTQANIKFLKQKAPSHFLPRTNASTKKKRSSASKQKKIKSQTFVNITKKIQKEEHQKISKNKSSKSKSKEKKSSIRNKKSIQKICIYTQRNKVDEKEVNGKKKSVSKKSIQKLMKKRTTTMSEQKNKSLGFLRKSQSKDKLKISRENPDKDKLKNMENKMNNERKKSKSKHLHPQYKMNKVVGAKNEKKQKLKI